jgi:hypothetical protein
MSKFFSGETSRPNGTVVSPAQLMTPTLRAALDELEKEFSAFLQSAAGQDADHHPDSLGTDP